MPELRQQRSVELKSLFKVDCIKFFRDSAGIAGYIDVSKIFRYFIKIGFSIYVEVMNSKTDEMLLDNDLLNSVLDFLISLVKNKFHFYLEPKDLVTTTTLPLPTLFLRTLARYL